MSDKWDMDEAYPPILWKDYHKVARPLVAEWVRCAGLTCSNEYALNDLADAVKNLVINVLSLGGMTRLIDLDEACFHKTEEDD